MTPSLEEWPTKAKETPSPHEAGTAGHQHQPSISISQKELVNQVTLK